MTTDTHVRDGGSATTQPHTLNVECDEPMALQVPAEYQRPGAAAWAWRRWALPRPGQGQGDTKAKRTSAGESLYTEVRPWTEGIIGSRRPKTLATVNG